jgi:hypothetical protein
MTLGGSSEQADISPQEHSAMEYRKFKVSTIKTMGMDLLENSKSAHHVSALLEMDFSDYRSGRRHAIEFQDVDLAFMVEKAYEGVKIPSTYILRAADGKSVFEIHEEIESILKTRLESSSPFANRKSR